MRGLVALSLLLLGCGQPEDEGGLPTLKVGGSDTLMSAVNALAEQHTSTRGSMKFRISGGGSGEGLGSLLDGDLHVAASTRRAHANEQEQARTNGFDLHHADARHIIGVNVVALSVHPSNTINTLTYDQVIGMFCTQEIDDWSFLGLEPSPIRAITRDPRSGTRALFEDFFCGPRGISSRVEVLSAEGIENALKDDPSAISFGSLAENLGKTLGLRPDPTGPPVRPSQQSIIRGAYPLYHDLYLFTAGAPDGPAQQFIDYAMSPAGQEIIDEQRFVPLFLRPERLDDARPLRETIHFDMGASQPNQRSAARLNLLIQELRDRAGEYRHVVLEGYTDNREADSIDLSYARADLIRNLLKAELPGLYFEIIPRGAVNPIAPNDTPYGRQRNRRVQIYLAAEEKLADIE